MAVKTGQDSNGLRHVHDLSSPGIVLDLTASPWFLQDGEASEILGLDVVPPRSFQPDRGRKPVGVTIPVADRPLTSLIEANTETLVGVQERFQVQVQKNDPTNSNPARNPLFLYVRVAGDAGGAYTTASGQVTSGTDSLTNAGNKNGDRIVIFKSDVGSPLNGTHAVISGSVGASNTLSIVAGLTVGNESNVRFFFAKGKQVVYIDDYDGDGTAALVKSPDLYDEEGPWDSDIVNGLGFVNSDQKVTSPGSFVVSSLASLGRENDALVLNNIADQTKFDTAGATPDLSKVTVTYLKKKDFRGFIVSNGRKFWLQQNGVYTLVLDLGSDTFKGKVWKGTQIASNRIMLVNPSEPPRILHFHRDSTTAGDESLAGCINPAKPPDKEEVNSTQVKSPSWVMEEVASAGALDAGDYKVLVRGVNLIDGIASNFVEVASGTVLDAAGNPTTATTSRVLTVALNSAIAVCPATNADELETDISNSSFTPPIHSRITHIEVWRTQFRGSIYQLETRMEIADPIFNEGAFELGSLMALFSGTDGTDEYTALNRYPIELLSANLASFPILTDLERFSNGLPPICQDIVSLNDVTICFGKASDSVSQATLFGKNFRSADMSWVAATTSFTMLVNHASTPEYRNTSGEGYRVADGDQVVVTQGGSRETVVVNYDGISEGTFDITDVLDGTGASARIEIAEILASTDVGVAGDDNPIHGYIQRPYNYDYPEIESDEHVWYSRTDRFAPESFPNRILQLSAQGDIFRRAVRVGDSVVVIMDEAVHLLFLSLTTGLLQKETVAQFGSGTPWPNSVVVEGDRVHWTTVRGISSLTVLPSVAQTGKRTVLQEDTSLRFADWFQEALDDSFDVDAGYDSRNGTIRFRRSRSSLHEYQSLVFSLKTKRMTLLDDDTGFRYVRSLFAEATAETTSRMYSVDSATGAVFQSYNRETAKPYAGFTVRGNLSAFDVTPTKILSPDTNVFSSSMVGEIIRFRKTDETEVSRLILTASTKKLTFASLTDIKDYAEFLVAPMRLRIRFAPLNGAKTTTVKKLEDVSVKLRPGPRGDTGSVTVKTFANFSETAVDTDSVSVFDDNASGKTSQDRVSSVEAAGTDVEVMLESLDTDNDFELELLEVVVREEASEIADSSEA